MKSTRNNEHELHIIDNNHIENLEIKKARCNRIIKDEKLSKKEGVSICGCGRAFNEHIESVINQYNPEDDGKEWNANNCTVEDGLTDAYGDMKFVNYSDNTAKYIRVHYKTPMDKMMQILSNHWNLKHPKLLISVTGGAQRFSLKPKLKDMFRKGLVKAAASTGAWISTGGFHSGVMKHVGEAIQEYATHVSPEDEIVVLGIAPWTMVVNSNSLIKNFAYEASNEVSSYSLLPNEAELKAKKQPLDPNHTHFILVDNAQVKYGGEIDFRGELESHISSGEIKIPIVVLVLEGGVGTIKTVLASVENGSPCVFVEGSGKCADIFAFAVNYIKERELQRQGSENFVRVDDKLENELRLRVRKEWGDKDVNDVVEKMKKTLDRPNLLSVFRLNSREHVNDIDVAILTALLKAHGDPKSQLNLALTWNRVDIARSYIFQEEINWKHDELDDIMYMAINEDKVDFVKLLVENSFNIRNFLTNRCLLKLYNDSFASNKTGKLSLLLLMLLKNETSVDEAVYMFDFKSIGSIIQKLVDDMYVPSFKKPSYSIKYLAQALKDTDPYGKPMPGVIQKTFAVNSLSHYDVDLEDYCQNAQQELFIYCILQLKTEMAKVFWRESNNGIYLAILASKIFKSYAREFEEEAEHLIYWANEFEELALNVIDKSYDLNEEKTQSLLIREIQNFSSSTVLQIAFAADDSKIIAHPCTQSFLTRLWYDKILPAQSWLYFKVAISCLCPFLAPIIIDYHEEKRHNFKNNQVLQRRTPTEMKTDTKPVRHKSLLESNRPLGYFEKIKHFVNAPLVKYIFNQVFYVLYLLLFSYVMVCDFFPVKSPIVPNNTNLGLAISLPEIVVIIWTFSFIFDKIRQFNESDLKLFRAKLRNFYNIWNIVETFAIILFLAGLSLRFIPNNTNTYLASRILFSFDVLIWYLKSMSYYAIFRNVGPKLVMIKSMLYELFQFITIVIVVMFAFGIPTQALLYHNQPLNYDLLGNIFLPAYFIVGGEYFTRDTIMGSAQCNQPNGTLIDSDIYTNIYNGPANDCPEYNGAQVALTIYVIYNFLLNVLLVNVLIAIFSYTFQKLQNETDNIWKTQRYALIYEYFHKPILAPPFILISFSLYAIRWLLKPILSSYTNRHINPSTLYVTSTDQPQVGFKIKFSPNIEKSLLKWEDFVIDEYMDHAEVKSRSTQDRKLHETLEKVELLKEKLDEAEFKMEEVLTILKDHYGIKSNLGSSLSDKFKKSITSTPIQKT